jgi:hypothetical protein
MNFNRKLAIPSDLTKCCGIPTPEKHLFLIVEVIQHHLNECGHGAHPG